MVEGGAMDFLGVKLNVNGFTGLSKDESLLVFFEGESNRAGSTFSLSKSSSNDLLTGEFTLLVEMMLGLPFRAEVFWATRPDKVSYVT